MFLLVAEFTHLFAHLVDPSIESSVLQFIGRQFHHHPWHGLRPWDLVQPFFMFIVGVALPLSMKKRRDRGQGSRELLRHALGRSLLLLLLGWGLHCIYAGKIVFSFQNVLAQLAVTYLLTYLLIRKPVAIQISVSFALIILTEVLYRSFRIEGFDQAFAPSQNFGTWFDSLYGGADLQGHWVSFNAIPTTAHTIWGALAGMLLMNKKSPSFKIRVMLIAGLVGLALGYGLDPVTPIIKRICTSSFVLVSGGWCFLALAFAYWLVDVKKKQKFAGFFAVVGMNPLFIYLFASVGGADLILRILGPFVPWKIPASILALTFLWYLCYFLYRRSVFIKL